MQVEQDFLGQILKRPPVIYELTALSSKVNWN